MIKRILFLILICSGNAVSAQLTLKIVLDSVPDFTHRDSVFIAGSFNGWNPSATKITYNSNERKFVETLNLAPGIYEFKFTKGGWEKVQRTKNGLDVENNLVNLQSDTTVFYTIEAWADAFKPLEKKHTASASVAVLDTAFYMPQLKTRRRIWVYLPQEYAHSKKRYPVLYMHDGQNVFDDYTSGYGEWGVDEALDTLSKQIPPCIVVAIDNGPERFNEYNPFDHDRFGKGKGDNYTDFIAKTLKPYIDAHFRTLPAKGQTLIAGSSMGGLISYYAALKYPDVFGKVGVFSPAFWTAPAIDSITELNAGKVSAKFFFYMGGLEGGEYENDMHRVAKKLGAGSRSLIYETTDPEGRHNEAAWRKWFPEFYRWMMAEGKNYVIETGH